MTIKGGSRPACAACSFHRRRCSSDCIFLRYFPANEPKIYEDVHRLYGAGNLTKMLNQCTNDDQKDELMISIKYEANVRQIHPVHGCYGVTVVLRRQLAEAVQELHHVRRMIEAIKRKYSSIEDMLINDVNDDQVLDGSSDWATAIDDHQWDDRMIIDHSVTYDVLDS